ncbi:hypothetical protein SDC9_211709 [bioreactor metagenome]|uniref:Uncharacterized protein n=1 Tax=bioreactor metagenome TaxID=1076179 RepID=A0A645JL10_9ZZZZ
MIANIGVRFRINLFDRLFIGVGIVMNQYGVHLDGVPDRIDDRQGVIFDLDLRNGRFGMLLGITNHHCDRLPEVPDLSLGKRRFVAYNGAG